MSLTSFIKRPEVIERLNVITPAIPDLDEIPLKCQPISNRYSLVGTAFDYALRFYLKRLNPHAKSRDWVAEAAPLNLSMFILKFEDMPHIECQQLFSKKHCPPGWKKFDQEASKQIRRIETTISGAKRELSIYLKARTKKPPHDELIRYAIRLAKLDLLIRPGILDQTFEFADDDDVRDIKQLLQHVPQKQLTHPKVMILNPTFGDSSSIVGGADADLIIGERLIDIKTSKYHEIRKDYLHQLIGYFILAKNEATLNKAFPKITRLGIYFSRQGHLWEISTDCLIGHTDFESTEHWFIKRARKLSR